MPLSNLRLAPVRPKTAVVTYTIAGTITDGVDPLAGVQVNLGAYQANTAADGTFTLNSVPAGVSGNLTPSKAGYTFTPAHLDIPALEDDLTGQDFTATADEEEEEETTFSISGTILDNGAAVVGATVTLGAYTAQTAADGSYSITGIPADTAGELTPTATNWVFTPAHIDVSAMAGSLTAQDFAGIETLLYDTFTDTDGTLLSAHTPDINKAAGTWATALGSILKISGNKAMVQVSEAERSIINVGQNNYHLTATVQPSGSSSTHRGVIVRSNSDNTACFEISFVYSGNWFRIYEGATIRAEAVITITQAAHIIDVVCNGTTITVTLDGANQVSYNSASPTGSYVGIQIKGTPDTVDNLKVDTL